MSDPKDKTPSDTPEEAFKDLSSGPLPTAFVQHYAAAFMAYWGASAESGKEQEDQPPAEASGQ
jgi:hypothetical protein